MRQLDEKDLAAIAKIQELRGCTIEWARQSYRQSVMKLADPDLENRAEVVLGNATRGGIPASIVKSVADVMITRNEKRLEKKEKKVKKAKPAKKSDQREEVPLVAPTRTVELTEVEKHVYTGTIIGSKKAVCWAETNYDKLGASGRFGWVAVSRKRLEAVKAYAAEQKLEVWIAVTIRVKGKLDQGYAIPLSVFEMYKLKSKNAVTLSARARKDYAGTGWNDCKFVEVKAAANAA